MYTEDDFVMLSALQHFLFCPRQCALIHNEQAWEENVLTAEGRIMHEKAHEERIEIKGSIRIERGVSLQSFVLGLSGKADVIEFHTLPDGTLRPFPVEYKRGKPKPDDCDSVQLCAQALCLEEMTGSSVPNGAIFYGKTRRRSDVLFDEALRGKTKHTAERLHQLLLSGETPRPWYSKRCDSCSLYDVCKPKQLEKYESVSVYVSRLLKESEAF